MSFPDLLSLGLIQTPQLLVLVPEGLLELLDSGQLLQIYQVAF